MTSDEHKDWKQTGVLRPAPGHIEGKHMTISAKLAAEWGRLFQQLGWESGSGRIVKIVFSPKHVGFIVRLGPKIDNIGPAYFAPADILRHAKITEVDS
jgi:hypothetical protein